MTESVATDRVPVVDLVADRILADAQLKTSGIESKNVRPGPKMPTTPDENIVDGIEDVCVFITPTGGRSGGARGKEEEPSVQLLIVGPPHDYDSGLAFADAVYDAVNLKPPVGFFDAQAVAPAAFLEFDGQGRPCFVINLLLKRQRDH